MGDNYGVRGHPGRVGGHPCVAVLWWGGTHGKGGGTPMGDDYGVRGTQVLWGSPTGDGVVVGGHPWGDGYLWGGAPTGGLWGGTPMGDNYGVGGYPGRVGGHPWVMVLWLGGTHGEARVGGHPWGMITGWGGGGSTHGGAMGWDPHG